MPWVPRPVVTQGRSAEPPGPQHPPEHAAKPRTPVEGGCCTPDEPARRASLPTRRDTHSAGQSSAATPQERIDLEHLVDYCRCPVSTFLTPSRGACGRSLRSRPRRPALPDLSSRMPGTSRASCGRRTHRLRRRSGSWRSGTTISETCVGSTSRCSLSGQAGMHTTLGPTLMISSARRRGIQAVGLLCRSYSYRESGLSSGASPQWGPRRPQAQRSSAFAPCSPLLEIVGHTMQHSHPSGPWRMEDQRPGATFASLGARPRSVGKRRCSRWAVVASG